MFRREDGLDRARRFFNRGDVDQAAWILWEARRRALEGNDIWRLAAIDACSAGMRRRLSADDRLPGFDGHLRGRESGDGGQTPTFPLHEDEDVDITPLSLGIALAGAAVMLVAVFLPQFESTTFSQIEKNTLIQNGDGWGYIVLAVLAAGAAYRAYRGRKRTSATVILGGLGIALAVYDGTSHSARELCSASSNFQSNCSLGTPGIGIYAAGVGALLVLIGGWQMLRADKTTSTVEEHDSRPALPGEVTIHELIVSEEVLPPAIGSAPANESGPEVSRAGPTGNDCWPSTNAGPVARGRAHFRD